MILAGWEEERVSSPSILRLIFQGRFLHGNVTLGGKTESAGDLRFHSNQCCTRSTHTNADLDRFMDRSGRTRPFLYMANV